jgi:AcrR family transcriptional regulator
MDMMANAPNPDRERNGARTSQAILDAAESLFAERGYEGTSLNDVGSEAGVSRGTPGYFFGSKASLYQAVIDRCFERVRQAIRSGKERALASGKDAETVLAGAVSEYFDFMIEHPQFVRLMEWEALSGGIQLQQALPLVEVVREALEAMSAELEVGPSHRETTAQLLLSIISLCWFPLVHSRTVLLALGLDPADSGFAESRKRHVVELVVQGAREQLALAT